MLNLNKTHILVLVLVLAVLLLPDVALAGTFDSLTNSGKQIFQGLRKIIYPASAVGIICVCIAGAFLMVLINIKSSVFPCFPIRI